MFSRIRWQVLALIVAALLFAISVMSRPAPEQIRLTPTPNPTTEIAGTVTPTLEQLQPTVSPISPEATPFENVVTYREALIGEVQRLNPLLAGLNPIDQDITSLMFEGLTRINEYGEVQPDLAREWVVSFDGLEYVVTLRDDVLWQDGIPFTADDVVYTMSLLSDADFPGAQALGNFWQTVETEKINDHLVRFRLPQRLGSFTESLRIGILPYHALQGTTAAQLADHPFNLDPIGTGPYQLEEIGILEGDIQTVDLRTAPVYRLRPEGQNGYALDRIRFQIYDSFNDVQQAISNGDIDGYAARQRTERAAMLHPGSTLALHTAHEPAVGVLIFNWVNDDKPFFREQRVRQALVTGLDRNSIIQRQLLNLAVRADSPNLRQSWAYDGSVQWPAFNLDTARNLLASSSAARNAEESGESLFSFNILTIDDPALVGVAQEIAAQWSLLNLDVTVEAVDLVTYSRRLINAEFDTAIVELSNEGSADPDVYDFWHQGRYPDGQNYGGANDRRISEALERGRQDENGTNRAVHYRDFQRAFIERAIAIPLYYPLFTYVMSPELQGVQLGFIGSPPDRFLTIQDWNLG